jgi:thiol-disulfide isomerase/thioredoxin
MSIKNRAKSKSIGSPLPLILAGAGLIMISIAVFVLIPGVKSLDLDAIDSAPAPGSVNYPAPELELWDIDWNVVSLSGLQGQVVLVNNWATWCPPCREEMPALEAYFRRHRDEGFTLVAINSGDHSSVNMV